MDHSALINTEITQEDLTAIRTFSEQQRTNLVHADNEEHNIWIAFEEEVIEITQRPHEDMGGFTGILLFIEFHRQKTLTRQIVLNEAREVFNLLMEEFGTTNHQQS